VNRPSLVYYFLMMSRGSPVGALVMMSISIISTMDGNPWAGSEELWADCSRVALASGDTVKAFLWKSSERRTKLDAQVKMGLDVRQYPSPEAWMQKRKQLFALRHPRWAGRLSRWFHSFDDICKTRPDVILLSLADTYVLGRHREFHHLVKILNDERIPYVIVVQLSVDHWVPDEVLSRVTRQAFTGAYRVGFVSEHNLRLVECQLNTSILNGCVLRNPVNLSSTAPVGWPTSPCPTMALPARFHFAHKGQNNLLKALSSSDWRNRQWRLRFHGHGPDGPSLRGLVASLGLTGHVEVNSHSNDIRALWADNQLLVMPSLMEGTPLAMVEAMLCGRPVVGTKVGGIPEWVEEGKSGFIADSPTVESLAAALERAWAARTTWESMGKVANERAMALHDPDPGLTLLKILEEAAS